MKVFRLNFGRLCSCFVFILNLIKKIFGRGRERKTSQSGLPSSASLPTESMSDKWEDWGDEFSIKIEPTSPPPDSAQHAETDEQDLFKDMTPVFQKPKKIAVKKTKSNPNQHMKQVTNRLNFDMTYPPPQADLGSWEDGDDSGGWDAEGMSEQELDIQADKVIREQKQAERERRAMEQQRKKEEREALRQGKKMQHLGTKLH